MFQSYSLNVCLYRPVYQSMSDSQHLFSIISLFQVVHKTPRTLIQHRLRFHICRKMSQINFFNGKPRPAPPIDFTQQNHFLPRQVPTFHRDTGRIHTPLQITTDHCVQRDVPQSITQRFSLCYSFNSQRARHVSLENTGDILFCLPVTG